MVLKLAEAKKIIDGAIAKARELRVEVSVTVCNQEGRLIALNRMDGVRFADASRETIGKAIISASCGGPSNRPTGWEHHPLTDTVIGEGAPATAGGTPIIRDDAIEGACGVS